MAVQKFTSSSSVTDWPIVCMLASQNPLILKNFRSFPIVKEIIDGYPDYAVYQYLYRIKTITGKNFKSFLTLWHDYDKQYSITDTVTYSFDENDFKLTPATGRGLVNVINYLTVFNKHSDECLRIAEIGAGIGSEYILLSKIVCNPELYGLKCNNIKNYTIFDLETSYPLIESNCVLHKVEPPLFITNYELNADDYFDLVISNGALTEISRDVVSIYFDKIISRSKNGYFLSNFGSHSSMLSETVQLSSRDFDSFLKKSGKDFKVHSDISSIVSKFDNKYNVLYVFGDAFKVPLKISSISYLFKLKLFIFFFIKKLLRIYTGFLRV